MVKIGIGPDGARTTRLKTGVGMPQLSAVLECADAAHRVGRHIISDADITYPGDMAKAFGGGANFVMVGVNLLAMIKIPVNVWKKMEGNTRCSMV